MVIDHIKVYQLDWDCSTDEEITCQNELDNFNYSVKKSINISSTLEDVEIESGEKTTFRVIDFFVITGGFEIENGAEFTVIIQNCP